MVYKHSLQGNQTKVGQNKAKPPVKWTKSDKVINKCTIFIFITQLLLVLIFGITGDVEAADRGEDVCDIVHCVVIDI